MDCSTNYHKNLKNLSGKMFGRLEVLRRDSQPGEMVRWFCRCECGNELSVAAGKLSTGHTKSCGCLRTDVNRIFNLSRHEFTGQVLGRLTVVERTFESGPMRWRCNCSCGGQKLASTLYLKTSREPSCGCAEYEAAAARRFIDLTGRRFGKLVASEHVGFDDRRKALWRCNCDCGGSKVIRGNSLTTGRSISCGCARSDPTIYMAPSALAESAAKCATRRARKLEAGGSYTPDQITDLYKKQRGLCAGHGCGVRLGDRYHRDHKVSLSSGGTNDILNIELLCGPCNHRKHAKDPITWAQQNGKLL